MPHLTCHSSYTTRILRLATFALLVILVLYLAINTSLAWGYVYLLTHSRCHEASTPIADLPDPQEHYLRTPDELILRTWYYPSQNGVALLVLGGPGGSLGQTQPPVAFLVKEGYGILQIDSRACAKPASAVTLGAKEVLDATAGLEFLQSQPEVEVIGAIGFSMGGVTAIRTAARNPEIAAVVAEGGFFNMGDDFIARGTPKSLPENILLYTVAAAYWIQIGIDPWQVSPVDDLPKISPRPVLLIYGEYEAQNGRAELQYAAARQPKELWIVPGGSHGRNHQVAPEEYETRVLEFFEQLIKER